MNVLCCFRSYSSSRSPSKPKVTIKRYRRESVSSNSEFEDLSDKERGQSSSKKQPASVPRYVTNTTAPQNHIGIVIVTLKKKPI